MSKTGQGLISALVGVLIIGVAMLGLMHMLFVLNFSQAQANRSNTWTLLKANVSQVLANTASCSMTVKQVKQAATAQKISILEANGAALLSNGLNLGWQLAGTNVTIQYVGGTTVPGYGGCTAPDTNKGHNNIIWGCGNVVTGNNNVVVGANNTVSSNNNTIYANNQTVTVNNTVTGGGTSAAYEQQAMITISASYAKTNKTYTQTFVVNLGLDTNLNILGCM